MLGVGGACAAGRGGGWGGVDHGPHLYTVVGGELRLSDEPPSRGPGTAPAPVGVVVPLVEKDAIVLVRGPPGGRHESQAALEAPPPHLPEPASRWCISLSEPWV